MRVVKFPCYIGSSMGSSVITSMTNVELHRLWRDSVHDSDSGKSAPALATFPCGCEIQARCKKKQRNGMQRLTNSKKCPMTFESKGWVYNSEKSVINRVGKKVKCQKPRNSFKEIKKSKI